jgi:transcriptional regulator with XRE-family HTH domain
MPQERLPLDESVDPMEARADKPVVHIEDLGNRLRERRRERQLTLEQAAQQIGVSAATLSRWERQYNAQDEQSTRKAPQPDVRTLSAITSWLGVSLDAAVEGAPVSTTHSTIVHHEGEELPDIVEAHLRADRNLDARTAAALNNLFRAAYKQFAQFSEPLHTEEEHAGDEPSTS